jgi:hypothetical protein
MGRGRQKAKQTKVARRLKYDTRPIDPERLQRELAGAPAPADGAEFDDADEFEGYDDEFGYDDEPEDEEREDEPRPSR